MKHTHLKKGGNFKLDPELVKVGLSVVNQVVTANTNANKKKSNKETSQKQLINQQNNKNDKIIKDFDKKIEQSNQNLVKQDDLLKKEIIQHQKIEDDKLKKKLKIEGSNKLYNKYTENTDNIDNIDNINYNTSFKIIGQTPMTHISDNNSSQTLYNSNINNDPEFINKLLYKIQYKIQNTIENLNKISKYQSNISTLLVKQKKFKSNITVFINTVNKKLSSYKNTTEGKLQKIHFLKNLKIEINKILSNNIN